MVMETIPPHRNPYRTTEWSGLKRATMLIWFQPPAVCRAVNQQTRLPRATSSLALNVCRDGASTASLGNLFQCISTLWVKNLLLTQVVLLAEHISLVFFPTALTSHMWLIRNNAARDYFPRHLMSGRFNPQLCSILMSVTCNIFCLEIIYAVPQNLPSAILDDLHP